MVSTLQNTSALKYIHPESYKSIYQTQYKNNSGSRWNIQSIGKAYSGNTDHGPEGDGDKHHLLQVIGEFTAQGCRNGQKGDHKDNSHDFDKDNNCKGNNTEQEKVELFGRDTLYSCKLFIKA